MATKTTYKTDTFKVLNYDPALHHFKLESPPLLLAEYANRNHIYINHHTNSTETSSGVLVSGVDYDYLRGKFDPVTGLVKLDNPVEVGYKPALEWKEPPPPASRFDDTPENKKANRAEVTALRRALEATTGMTAERFIAAVTPLQNKEQSVYVSISTTEPDLEAAVTKAMDEVKFSDDTTALIEAFKGVDMDCRTRTLRHLAHLFNIGKGSTWLR